MPQVLDKLTARNKIFTNLNSVEPEEQLYFFRVVSLYVIAVKGSIGSINFLVQSLKVLNQASHTLPRFPYTNLKKSRSEKKLVY